MISLSGDTAPQDDLKDDVSVGLSFLYGDDGTRFLSSSSCSWRHASGTSECGVGRVVCSRSLENAVIDACFLLPRWIAAAVSIDVLRLWEFSISGSWLMLCRSSELAEKLGRRRSSLFDTWRWRLGRRWIVPGIGLAVWREGDGVGLSSSSSSECLALPFVRTFRRAFCKLFIDVAILLRWSGWPLNGGSDSDSAERRRLECRRGPSSARSAPPAETSNVALWFSVDAAIDFALLLKLTDFLTPGWAGSSLGLFPKRLGRFRWWFMVVFVSVPRSAI